jgi:diacylglycerol kinase
MTKQQQKFSLKSRLKSFRFAFNGLKVLFVEEHNARIHLFATALVIALGFYLNISLFEWIALVFAIGFVLAAETFNSALENMSDFISEARNIQIKKIKDLSAAAVLISAITALVIGRIIFVPKIIMRF